MSSALPAPKLSSDDKREALAAADPIGSGNGQRRPPVDGTTNGDPSHGPLDRTEIHRAAVRPIDSRGSEIIATARR